MKRLFALTPEAKSDLKEILLDIAEDSPATAERLRTEFYEGLQALGRSPGIGHFHDDSSTESIASGTSTPMSSSTSGTQGRFR